MSAPREAGVVPLLVRQLDLQLFSQKLSQPSYIILQQPCLGVAAEYIFHIWCICQNSRVHIHILYNALCSNRDKKNYNQSCRFNRIHSTNSFVLNQKTQKWRGFLCTTCIVIIAASSMLYMNISPVSKELIIIIYMLIVQYPMQFSGTFRSISNPCSSPLCAGKW